METSMAKYKLWLTVLTLLVVVLLLFNGGLIFALFKARGAALDVLASVRNSVAMLGKEPFETVVHIDQEIPLNTVVPVSQTLTVPLDIQYPLSTSVNTYFDLPVLGQQEVAIPIDTVIPIQYDLTVPLQMNYPISMTYRLQMDVPISVEIPDEIRIPVDQFLEQIEAALR